LTGHNVQTAFEMGWSDLENGALLAAAENSFNLFITTDQQLRYQQKSYREKAKYSRTHNHELATH
jgi:hypothetical protein